MVFGAIARIFIHMLFLSHRIRILLLRNCPCVCERNKMGKAKIPINVFQKFPLTTNIHTKASFVSCVCACTFKNISFPVATDNASRTYSSSSAASQQNIFDLLLLVVVVQRTPPSPYPSDTNVMHNVRIFRNLGRLKLKIPNINNFSR